MQAFLTLSPSFPSGHYCKSVGGQPRYEFEMLACVLREVWEAFEHRAVTAPPSLKRELRQLDNLAKLSRTVEDRLQTSVHDERIRKDF